MIYSFRLGGTFTTFSAPAEEVEALTGVAVDVAGNAYVTGYTAYKRFPDNDRRGLPQPSRLGDLRELIVSRRICQQAE